MILLITRLPVALLSTLLAAAIAPAQVTIEGRIHAVDPAAPDDPFPLGTILATAALPGPESEARSFRTWETEPAGWFRLSGTEGRYTVALANPAHFMRPRILTNQFLRDGEQVDLRLRNSFDFACFHDQAWDPEPAKRYLQPFFARGTSITSVGFRLATDGVDGPGPGAQDIVVSIHRRTSGPPGDWPQVGPAATVPGVDCGGAKSYWFSAGWQSAEVPTEPGQQYAVSLQPADSNGVIQTFWRARPGGSPGVYRFGSNAEGFDPHDLWLAVASDHDGLLIPYNKRVHRKFSSLTNLEQRWSQTWVAQGRALASVVLYAAVSGRQPPLSRQRVTVRVRQGGPEGETVGIEKIAVGNGNYTGDASWGHFVAVFAPDEVPLTPGETYALEFESIETPHTIGDFVNIKGQKSDGRAGFNPYRKEPGDDYPDGTAYRHGTERQDFDLDLQIVEYEHNPSRWDTALAGPELLVNGDMEGSDPNRSAPHGWQPFQAAAGTQLSQSNDDDSCGRFLRVAAKEANARIDGGWVQCVRGLDRSQTYRLAGSIRSTWPAGTDHRCLIGVDPTGQTGNPDAKSIEWTLHPARHGEWILHRSGPHRPQADSISIWLRAICERDDTRFPFQADFDHFSLRRVDDGVPLHHERRTRSGFIDRIPPEAQDARDARLDLVRQRRAAIPVLVHRGASRFAPENTLQAFATALDRGADGFEIDIRRSADGVLYVFHDDTLDRMTDGSGPVHGRSYFELLGFDVGASRHVIPTLAAVFTLARDRSALLHLDVKEPGLEPEILRLIDAADLWEHLVEVNAGNAESIRRHSRVNLLRYKGWFPDDPQHRAAFLAKPGDMVFTKSDPLDAVQALGRNQVEPVPLPSALQKAWTESNR